VAAWRSGNGVGRINEVTQRRARLVLGWWPSSSSQTTSVWNQPLRPTQPSTLRGTENEYRPKCGDAVQLQWSKRGSFHIWINVSVEGKTAYLYS